MKDFIAYIIKNLVDQPDEVKVNIFDGEKSTVVEIQVDTNDIAKLVGRQGRTKTAGRSRMTPKEVCTGVAIGAR
ncbi:MAG: KH domain-containing protein [Chlamydiales bacterium]|nr:KH domain-containing protein [Chlamydiales bacterium]